MWQVGGHISPTNNILKQRELIPDLDELLHLILIFDYCNFTIGVVSHILACLRTISSVDANGQTASEDGPVEGYAPFGRIEA